MNKKKIFFRSLAVAVCASLFALTSCEDMLTVDSARYQPVDNNTLSSPGDSVSSVLGLLQSMQKVGERYILLGEMRADLLDVTDSTTADIRQLSNFTVDPSNKYADPRDYYAIINNCNYFISRTAGATSPLRRENALVHAIRTWTYLQIATNWGKAYYFSKPLLSVDDTQKSYPALDFAQLADSLIADLEPFANAGYPDYGVVYNFKSAELFLPIKVLLGDLYLWRGRSTSDYEQAATYYAEFINTRRILSPMFISWSYENFQLQNFETSSPMNPWSLSTIASTGTDEMITAIQMAQDVSKGVINHIPFNIKQFGYSNEINDLWEEQNYTLVHGVGTSKTINPYFGDLRKQGNLSKSFTFANNAIVSTSTLYKLYYSDHILLYRMGLIYLRYAEAINRAGNPQAAFAVLKYGLKPTTFDGVKIPNDQAIKPYISIFNNERYSKTYTFIDKDNNKEEKEVIIGIHARGCGDAAYDNKYQIESFKEKSQDTIEWVENAICTELALETSFEGNRFGDLVRLASRRGDNSFLAKRIALKQKNVSDYNRIYDHLSSDKKNWFLPEPINKQ